MEGIIRVGTGEVVAIMEGIMAVVVGVPERAVMAVEADMDMMGTAIIVEMVMAITRDPKMDREGKSCLWLAISVEGVNLSRS